MRFVRALLVALTRRGPVRLAIVGVLIPQVLVVGLIGCEREVASEHKNCRNLPTYADDPIDVYLGQTHLRMPWNVMWSSAVFGKYCGPGPFRTGSLVACVDWPAMTGRGKASGYPDGQICLVLGAVRPPDPAVIAASADEKVRRFIPVDGPYLNETLGLREWRHPVGGKAVGFARKDVDYRSPMGVEPFATCDWWDTDKLWWCRSSGWITDRIPYRYSFNPTLLKDWPKVDEAIFKLFESFIVEEN